MELLADRFPRSNRVQARMHDLIPGGAHTYARGDDQYPENAAPVIERGRGAHVWDLDGHRFVEYGMGLRAVTLGHAYRPVVEAVGDALARGNSFTRATSLELAAAEDFLSVVPGADMVKFAKNGSDATTAAVRLARAATGRDMIAIADQAFFSRDDWFIGTTPMAAGVPDAERARTVRFPFDDLEAVRALLDRWSGRIAAIVLEPTTTTHAPSPGYLEGLRALCDATGTVLVFDEMITGRRWHVGGAQAVYGVVPDLSTWGKAIGNGFAIAALAGRRELMELGGLRTDAERVFLLSTTSGPEAVGLVAMRAVLEAYRTSDPVAVMRRTGERLAAEATAAIADAGLSDHLEVVGHPSCLLFVTRDAEGRPSQDLRTIFMGELLRGGVLGQSFVVSAAHTDRDVDETIAALHAALPTYRKGLEAEDITEVLEGRPVAQALRPRAAPRRR